MFKMSSMLGGALGVALLVAVQRALQRRRGGVGRAAAGLSESDIDKLQAALVNSDAANQVLNSVSPDQRTQLLEAGKGVVADATAGAMWVTAALGPGDDDRVLPSGRDAERAERDA